MGPSTSFLVLGTLIIGLVMAPLAFAGEPCCTGDPSVGTSMSHQVIMLQGDDPTTDSEEPRDDVHVLDRSFWSIPWDSDEVYTYIDPRARNISLDNVEIVEHQGSGIFVPGPYSGSRNPADPPARGWVTEGPYTGTYHWRFPEGAYRNKDQTIVFATDEDFGDFDPVLTDGSDWIIEDDTLTLGPNVTNAVYTSKKYTGGVDIVTVNMTRTGNHTANMTFEVTADNGTTWLKVEHGQEIPIPGLNGQFRWRVTMTQELSLNATPVLDNTAFKIAFTPATTDIWLEASYTLDIEDRELESDLQFPFDGTDSTFVYLGYFDHDMELAVEGTEVIVIPGGTYPSKVTYRRMMGEYASVVTILVVDTDDPVAEQTYLWLAIAIPLVLILIVVLVYLLVGRRTGALSEDEDAEGEEEDDGDDVDIDRLRARKSDLMATIGRLDMEHDDDEIPDGDYEQRRAQLKAETIEVMRRIEELEEGE